MSRKSTLEALLKFQMNAIGLYPVDEFRFHPIRKWRFDFAFIEQKLAIECEGGTWQRKGGHTTGIGYERDCHKYNAALILGWRVLRFTTGMIKSGVALQQIEAALEDKAA
jgi:very-short-patch-repair endonuclease